jgi:diguanylate cyclase (GGDEF)-like protein/PAS domain S-box-containing protein
VLGILSFRPKAEVLARWQPLANYLNGTVPGLGLRIRALTYPELNAAIAGGELDFVLTNPAHYIELRQSNRMSGAIATLIESEHGHALTQFGGVIVSLARRTDIANLRDLAGKHIAMPDTSSLGGYQMQAFELVRAGVRLPDQDNILVTGMPHDRAIEAVLARTADAGFIRTGVLEQMAAEGKIDPALLRVLDARHVEGFPYALSTRLYPEWPFVAMPRIEGRLSRRVASALLVIDADMPLSSAIGIQGFSVPADYSPVEELMRELRVPPFDAALAITPSDVWQRYHLLVVVGGAAIGIILLMAMRLGVANRGLAVAQRRSAEIAERLHDSEERLRLAVNGVNDGIWDWDLRSDCLYLSPKWKEMIGYRDDELPNVPATFKDRLHAEDRTAVYLSLARYLRGRSPFFAVVFRFRHKDGSWRWILGRGEVQRDADGLPLRMVGSHTDITMQKQAEDDLRLSASVFASSQEGVLIADADKCIIDVNPAFTRITGYLREEVLGQNPSILNSGRQDVAFYRDMWRHLSENGSWRGEVWNRRKDGQIYAELLSIACVRDKRGRPQRYVGVFSDISPLKAQEAALDRLANYDSLTGMPSRRLLDDRLAQALASARRLGHLAAICYLDLDGFKPINDSFGHQTGDQILVAVANAIQDVLRGSDTLARIGGDEFVLLLSDVDTREHVELSIKRVLAAIRRPLPIDGNDINVSASIGIAIFPDHGTLPEILLQHADTAMYAAKKQGKNGYRLFEAELAA